jgi:hypothetical protein
MRDQMTANLRDPDRSNGVRNDRSAGGSESPTHTEKSLSKVRSVPLSVICQRTRRQSLRQGSAGSTSARVRFRNIAQCRIAHAFTPRLRDDPA